MLWNILGNTHYFALSVICLVEQGINIAHDINLKCIEMVKLHSHQLNIVTEDPKKCGLFLGTGSGKGLIGIMLAQGRVLVVCPKTLKQSNTWHKALTLSGRKDITLTVVSKEEFRRDHEKLSACDTLILDEVHTIAGLTPMTYQRKKIVYPKMSQLLEATLAYIKRTSPSRIYGLSATPTRSPMCVLGIAWILGKTWDFYQFRNIYYHEVRMGTRNIWMVKNDQATKDRLGKAVRNLGYVGKLSDYFDFPPQTFITKEVSLTKEQKIRLKRLPIEFPDPIVLCGKRSQVENGIFNGDTFNPTEYFSNEKLDAIVEYSYEFQKMIIFSKYIHQIEEIEKALTSTGKKVFIITGDTKNRGDIIQQAEATKECVLIVSAQISAGWEAPSFSVMIFASMSHSIVDRIQSEGRILRANSLQKTLYITLVAVDDDGTVDMAIDKAIQNKQDFSEAIYAKII